MLVNRNDFDINKVIAKLMKAYTCSGSTKDFHDALRIATHTRALFDSKHPDAENYNMYKFYESIEFQLMREDPVAAHWFIRNRAVTDYIYGIEARRKELLEFRIEEGL